MYSTLKAIHVGFAITSISGFLLRATWMFFDPTKLERRMVRIAPHVIDTAFLISGIWLAVLLRLDVTAQDWLIAKLCALVAYIVFGSIALRRGRTIRIRTAAFALALATYLYIAGVALTKSPGAGLL